MKTTLTALLIVVGLAVLGSVESKPKEAPGTQARDGAQECEMEGKECWNGMYLPYRRCCPV